MPRLHFHLLLFSLLSSLLSLAQVNVSGHLSNQDSKEPISNVHIIYDNGKGTFTDLDGYFELSLSAGSHQLVFQHLAFKTKSLNVSLTNNSPKYLEVRLKTKYDQLETVVLSAGKFEQRLEDISVSLDLIKGKTIDYQNNYNIERSIAQAPGVHVIDGQINIRGGSGWSYGAGSRGLVLLDGLPLTNAST